MKNKNLAYVCIVFIIVIITILLFPNKYNNIASLDESLNTFKALYDGDTITFISRYSDTSDIEIVMGKHGGNSLFDFIEITEVFDNQQRNLIIHNYSDCFSPYRIRAINSIDVDCNENHFTGDNHQYNNTSMGSTNTARGEITKVLFDGAQSDTFNGQCSKVDVYWTNYIQGQNTKKEDGTGREILKEDYHLLFDGEKIYIDNTFTTLEDIEIQAYYGLCFGSINNSFNYNFIGNYGDCIVDAPANAESTDKSCRKVIIYDDNHIVIMTIDDDSLGNQEYNDTNYSSMSAEYGKVYFNLINHNDNWKVLPKDTSYHFSGSFQFLKK